MLTMRSNTVRQTDKSIDLKVNKADEAFQCHSMFLLAHCQSEIFADHHIHLYRYSDLEHQRSSAKKSGHPIFHGNGISSHGKEVRYYEEWHDRTLSL